MLYNSIFVLYYFHPYKHLQFWAFQIACQIAKPKIIPKTSIILYHTSFQYLDQSLLIIFQYKNIIIKNNMLNFKNLDNQFGQFISDL
jgi:hypothetical protein